MTPCLKSQWIDRLFSVNRVEGSMRKSGIFNSHLFAQALGKPFKAYPCIHVAGSNGKGSVSLKIAKALELSGLCVGLYTSPHLFDFSERICINSKPIDLKSVEQGLELIFSIEEQLGIEATFFDLTTQLAFYYFQQAGVDVAVIETGLGGRLDATNILEPILTVITSISCEHKQYLGDTPEKIAEEKAGILKPRIPCVIGPHADLEPIRLKAQKLQCPLIVSKETSSFFDDENQQIAKEALKVLKPLFNVQEIDIEEGIKKRPRCRFEIKDFVIFDVAHNPDAFSHLVTALDRFFPCRNKRFLVGLCKDKEIDRCLEKIIPVASHIHLVQASFPRAATADDLEEALKGCRFEKYSTHQTITQAMDEALTSAYAEGELLIVCGSFYIMKEALYGYECFAPL